MDQYDSLLYFVIIKDKHGRPLKVKCQICGYETWFVKSKHHKQLFTVM